MTTASPSCAKPTPPSKPSRRRLFKSWFVDFDPVRAKSQGLAPAGMDEATADLFPDSFEESALGLVPQGWRNVSLRDAVTIFDSRRVPLSGQERAVRKGEFPYYGAAALMDHVDDFIFDGVHLLAGEDGSVADQAGLPITQYVWGKFWVNNHAHVLQGKGVVCTEHVMLSLKHKHSAVHHRCRSSEVEPGQHVANHLSHAFNADRPGVRASD